MQLLDITVVQDTLYHNGRPLSRIKNHITDAGGDAKEEYQQRTNIVCKKPVHIYITPDPKNYCAGLGISFIHPFVGLISTKTTISVLLIRFLNVKSTKMAIFVLLNSYCSEHQLMQFIPGSADGKPPFSENQFANSIGLPRDSTVQANVTQPLSPRWVGIMSNSSA